MRLTDSELEQNILGKIIYYKDEDLLVDLVSMLGKDYNYFFIDEHKVIYHTIYKLFKSGEIISISSIKDTLDIVEKIDSVYTGNKTLLEFVGEDYLNEIIDNTNQNRDNHSDLKRFNNLAANRNLKKAFSEGKNMLESGSIKGTNLVNFMQSKFSEIDIKHSYEDNIPLQQLIDEEFRIIEEIKNSDDSKSEQYLYTDINTIDNKLGGFKPGQLIIIAARPAMGKTQLALVMAHNMALQKKHIYFHSLEMRKTELAMRVLCFRNNIVMDDFSQGIVNEVELDKMKTDAKNLFDIPLHLEDERYVTPSVIKSKAMKLKQKEDIDAIFVDYLQLMNSEYNHQSVNNKVGHITRMLKILAGELNIPVFILSQLSRKTESRTNKRPQLADLRDSGNIEQDADIVAFLYRDYYYDKDANQFDLEVNWAKRRNGTTGTTKLWYYPKTGQIKDK